MAAVTFEPLAILPTGCVLGEGPVWDDRRGVLWLTDIQSAQLLRIDWATRDIERMTLPERLGSLALIAGDDRLLCAFASGFALFDPTCGATEWLTTTEPEYRGVRMNDGRVDRQGRFWCGSMVERENGSPASRGSLYRLDPTKPGEPVAVLDGISISNSICFAPSGDRMYFADTPSQRIGAFDIDPSRGSIISRRDFAQLAGSAYPDGSDVDAAGRLWNAEWGTGCITVYAPDGEQVAQLDLPVSQATCIAFGGPDLNLLFVTTARESLPPEQLAREPHAGDVLVYRTDACGLPPCRFGG